MNRSKNRKQVYVVDGVARDQETIIAQKPWMEDWVRDNVTQKFSKTKLIWEMVDNGQFSFKLFFYA